MASKLREIWEEKQRPPMGDWLMRFVEQLVEDLDWTAKNEAMLTDIVQTLANILKSQEVELGELKTRLGREALLKELNDGA